MIIFYFFLFSFYLKSSSTSFPVFILHNSWGFLFFDITEKFFVYCNNNHKIILIPKFGCLLLPPPQPAPSIIFFLFCSTNNTITFSSFSYDFSLWENKTKTNLIPIIFSRHFCHLKRIVHFFYYHFFFFYSSEIKEVIHSSDNISNFTSYIINTKICLFVLKQPHRFSMNLHQIWLWGRNVSQNNA